MKPRFPGIKGHLRQERESRGERQHVYVKDLDSSVVRLMFVTWTHMYQSMMEMKDICISMKYSFLEIWSFLVLLWDGWDGMGCVVM